MKVSYKWLFVLVGLLLFALIVASNIEALQDLTTNFTYGINFSRNPTVSPGAYIEHETSGVLNFATSESGIGNLRLTGVPGQLMFDIGTMNQTWIAKVDTDNGILFGQDVQLDSMRLFASFGSADTITTTLYDNNDSVPNTISGPDTFVNASPTWKSKTFTANSSSQLDQSAGEGFALYMLESGAIDSLFIIMYYHTYDSQ